MNTKHSILDLADDQYPQVDLDPLKTTHEQRSALFRKWKQAKLGDGPFDMPWIEFAKTAQPTSGMDGAIVVQWCGMWLAIETDGYTHS